MLDRIEKHVVKSSGHYESLLGWSLMIYPAETLQPHRERILKILEKDSGWPTAGLLARLGELGGDPSELIIQRLDARSGDTQRAAAVAVCRSPPDVWTKLQPAVFSRLRVGTGPANPSKSVPLSDQDVKLLVALTRFGKKDVALGVVEAFNPADKNAIVRRLSALDESFPLSKCQ